MKNRVSAFTVLSAAAIAAALVAGAGTAIASAGQATPETVVFATTLINDEHPGGEADGTLRLQFGNDGTISGYFQPVDSGANVLVNGGLDGQRIHLNIAGSAPITGTYVNGKIVGYELVGTRTHRFTATRSAWPTT